MTASPTTPAVKNGTRCLVTPSRSKPIGSPTSAVTSSATDTAGGDHALPARAGHQADTGGSQLAGETERRQELQQLTGRLRAQDDRDRCPASGRCGGASGPPGRSPPRSAATRAAGRPNGTGRSSARCRRRRRSVTAPEASDAVVSRCSPRLVTTACWVTARPSMPAASPPAACAASIAARAARTRVPASKAAVSSNHSVPGRRLGLRPGDVGGTGPAGAAGELAGGGGGELDRCRQMRGDGRRGAVGVPVDDRAHEELRLGDVLRLVDHVAGEAGVLPRAGEHRDLEVVDPALGHSGGHAARPARSSDVVGCGRAGHVRPPPSVRRARASAQRRG